MRFWQFLLPLLTAAQCLAVQGDRITAPIDPTQKIVVPGNVHGLAQPQFDLGRTDSSRMIRGVYLAFRPSAAQQKDLENLLAEQQDRSSSNFHKWLTPAQFADRFGMTQADINRVVDWLESQGFVVTSVANGRNQIAFDGPVGLIESVFATEIHDYAVNGEIHFANSNNPSVPAALAPSTLSMGHLHDFRPRPRFIRPHFTSSLSGSHFLTPSDFATIYDLQPVYSAGIDGTGQSIVVVGQTAIYTSDIDNFRSAAGLAAKQPTQVLVPGSGTSVVSSGDLTEADLDLEWSNGVARSATVVYVYVGNGSGFSVWDSIHHAVQNNLAPVISSSYGYCEPLLPSGFPQTVQGWAQQANAQGQTIVASSGDSGAADCDGQVASATQGMAVDVPASIPEVTGVGGTEFVGDPASTSTTTYWQGATGSDTISSALSYIPEEAWNDTAANNSLSASGGGTSVLFSKPSWQTGTGVPSGMFRDVPDVAFSASPDHDSYLICSQTDPSGNPSCTSGFRDSKTFLDAIGGTSASAPSFAAMLSLINQYLGSPGLGNVNSVLYGLAASNPTAFNDLTTSDNIVPCTSGSKNCPSVSPFKYGFSAGAGYDQVTGLGSVDAHKLAVAWQASQIPSTFSMSASPSTLTVSAGQTATSTITITPAAGFAGAVNFTNSTASNPGSCSAGLPAGALCSFNPTSVSPLTSPTTVLTITTAADMALPSGAQTVTITGTNPVTGGNATSTTAVSLTISATTQTFTLSTTASTFPVAVGGTAAVPLTVASTSNFINSNNTTTLPLTYSCSGIPANAEIACQISPGNGQPTNATAVTVNLVTTPVTTQMLRPSLRGTRIFYAVLLPGVFGVVFSSGSRSRRSRLLSMFAVLAVLTFAMLGCGGSNSSNSLKNAGTPPGTYAITINATTGGAQPINGSVAITLNVTK